MMWWTAAPEPSALCKAPPLAPLVVGLLSVPQPLERGLRDRTSIAIEQLTPAVIGLAISAVLDLEPAHSGDTDRPSFSR